LSLWHALALKFDHNPAIQVARAKATAMDIITIQSDIPKYRDASQFVALQAVNSSIEHRDAAEHWLRHAKADVLVVVDDNQLASLVDEKIAAL
jgi:hypothetical protein